MNARAVTYRRLYRHSASWGTAVNVQPPWSSVTWARPWLPASPSPAILDCDIALYGEFLVNAQGEDVVGIRTLQNLTEAARIQAGSGLKPSLETVMPAAYTEFKPICGRRLEKHYRDTQDVEFTAERVSRGCSSAASASAPPRRR